MLNQFVIVGKIASLPTKSSNDNAELKVRVTQDYKDAEGNNVESSVRIKITANMSNQLENYCKINDTIGVKGYIDDDIDDYPVLIGTKITCLSSKQPSIEEQPDSEIDMSGEI